MTQEAAKAPSDWVRRFMHLARPEADVLDLAAGRGRHTALFSAAGYKVTAVDRDISQLGALAGQENVETLQADLEGGEGWPLAGRTFGAIVVTNYLHRPLIPHLLAGLSSGGVLLYETFAEGNERFGKPSNPDFLLKPGELLEAVAGVLTVVAYEHGVRLVPREAVVQRICAVNGPAPVRLAPH